jgi:hypothetical protein
MREGIEVTVHAARLLDHRVEVFCHSRLVESVDLRRLGRAASGGDLLGHCLHPRGGTSGEKDPGPLARERTGDGVANGAAGSVDDGVLVLEQQICAH